VTAAETPVIAGTVGSLLGKTAAAWRAPEFGLSAADRLVVTFSDGSAAFVKGATTEETAGWLRNEHGSSITCAAPASPPRFSAGRTTAPDSRCW
jgi:hypothetical protein